MAPAASDVWTLPTTSSGVLDSPSWQCGLWVTYGGPVLSKANYRRRHGSTTRAAGQSWAALKTFEHTIALSLRAARPQQWVLPAPTVVLAARPKVVAAILTRGVLDAGNVSKSVLDASEGILVANDAEVAAVTELVARTRSGPGMLVGFAQLPPLSDLRTCATAVTALVDALLRL